MHNWGEKGRINVIGATANCKNVIAPSLFNSSINSDIFNYWIEHELLPRIPNNSVIVMDNASFHKHKKMQKIVAQAGIILEYLPPYSPDLNPIEHTWAYAKSLRRKFNCSIDVLFSKFIK
jgi:transposase